MEATVLSKLELPAAAVQEPTPEPQVARLHGATVKYVYDQLREDILRRRLGPGSRLVEHDLTQRFAVSRGPVREAMRRLAAEGLIEHVPNRGGTVRRLSRTEMRELFDIRVSLETLAARLAAQNHDPIAQAGFRAAAESMLHDSPRDFSTYMDENAAFHAAILTLAGSKTLRELVDRLQLTLLMGQVSDRFSDDVLKISVSEHRAILNAILNHDAESAAAAMRAHLERAAAFATSDGLAGRGQTH